MAGKRDEVMTIARMPAWLEKAAEQSKEFPQWVQSFCQEQWQAFWQQGLPTRKQEQWKYTDLSLLATKEWCSPTPVLAEELQDVLHQHRLQRGESILLLFVNGYFMPMLSDLHKLPANVIACSLATALKEQGDRIQSIWHQATARQKYPFVNLNAAHCFDGLFLSIPDQCELETPIHILSLAIGEEEFIAHPQQIILLGKQSKITLLEEHFALREKAYLINKVTHCLLEAEALLNHYKIQNEGKQAIHFAHTFIQQKQDSQLHAMQFSFGSLFARDDMMVNLMESGANCRTAGFYHLQQDQQYIDYHLDIQHAAPHTQSEMLYKGIIDKNARAVFNGKLHVESGAQKILAYQANHNLLLSTDAEVYSKPELEIYANDVKCKHGATTGQLDQDALFYMRARGIDEAEAIAILLQGFAEEIVDRVLHPGIKMRVQEWM